MLYKPRSVYRRALSPWGVCFDIKIKAKKDYCIAQNVVLIDFEREREKAREFTFFRNKLFE